MFLIVLMVVKDGIFWCQISFSSALLCCALLCSALLLLCFCSASAPLASIETGLLGEENDE